MNGDQEEEGPFIRIGITELWREIREMHDTLIRVDEKTGAMPDLIRRVQSIERWKYGVPVTAILTALTVWGVR